MYIQSVAEGLCFFVQTVKILVGHHESPMLICVITEYTSYFVVFYMHWLIQNSKSGLGCLYGVVHAREPLNLNSAVIVCWLQSVEKGTE